MKNGRVNVIPERDRCSCHRGSNNRSHVDSAFRASGVAQLRGEEVADSASLASLAMMADPVGRLRAEAENEAEEN